MLGDDAAGDYHALICVHIALYYAYRRQHLSGLGGSTGELWALREMKKPCLAADTRFFALLDGYVHDSLAGFSLTGFGSDEEKAEALPI